AGAAVAEHRMVEEVEELQAELQFGTLAQDLRQAPVLVKREVHIPDVRAMALSSLGLWRLAENITVHGEGIGVDIPQIVSAKAGLPRHHRRTNAKIREGAVADHPPRICAKGRAAGYSTGERDAVGALQSARDGEGIAGCNAHYRAGLPSTSSGFQKAIPPFEPGQVVNQTRREHVWTVEVGQSTAGARIVEVRNPVLVIGVIAFGVGDVLRPGITRLEDGVMRHLLRKHGLE